MKAKRFSEEQIIGALKEAEAGAKTKELCRQNGISETTFSQAVAQAERAQSELAHGFRG